MTKPRFKKAPRYAVLAAAAAAAIALLAAIPALGSAQSNLPCDSETVVPAGQDDLRADCRALWAFYSQLTDPGQLDDAGSEQWGSNTPLSSWRGVTVDTTSNRVTRLQVTGAGLFLTKSANSLGSGICISMTTSCVSMSCLGRFQRC